MFAIKCIISFLVLLLQVHAVASCKEVRLKGFTKIKSQNAIQVVVNAEKSATFAVQCRVKSTSDQEAIESFSKLGGIRKLKDNLYSADKRVSGVISRSYLFLSTDIYQMSFVVKSVGQLENLEEDLQQNLKSINK